MQPCLPPHHTTKSVPILLQLMCWVPFAGWHKSVCSVKTVGMKNKILAQLCPERHNKLMPIHTTQRKKRIN
uniref:Secreted protein n=1 Tax=Anguilla anguilla TaxID=7936 RepID=A0A0E9W989_ANGAN